MRERISLQAATIGRTTTTRFPVQGRRRLKQNRASNENTVDTMRQRKYKRHDSDRVTHAGAFKRAGFAWPGGASPAGSSGQGAAEEGAATRNREAVFAAARGAPVRRTVDVLVCGDAGRAGLARRPCMPPGGSQDLLSKPPPFLGGVWTAVGVSHLIEGRRHGGLNAEIHQRLPVHQVFGRNIYVIEEMKSLLDRMMDEAGVVTQFHTRAVAVARDGARLSGVFTSSKAGLEFIEANVVVDATGDGDVAAAAGCDYEMGRDLQTGPAFPTPGHALSARQLVELIGGEPALNLAGRSVEILEPRGAGRGSYPPVTLFPQPGESRPGVFSTHGQRQF